MSLSVLETDKVPKMLKCGLINSEIHSNAAIIGARGIYFCNSWLSWPGYQVDAEELGRVRF